MARKKKDAEIGDDLEGTVEGLARDHFEREKAAYEERTGEKVLFEPPLPVTRTPIAGQSAVSSQQSADDETAETEAAEGDGEN